MDSFHKPLPESLRNIQRSAVYKILHPYEQHKKALVNPRVNAPHGLPAKWKHATIP